MENQLGSFLCLKLTAPLCLETEARVSSVGSQTLLFPLQWPPLGQPLCKRLRFLNQKSTNSVSPVPGTPPCLARHHLLHYQLFLVFSFSSRLPSAPAPRVRDSLSSQSTQPCRDL